MEINEEVTVEETKSGIFSKFPKAFRVVVGIFLILIVLLVLLVVIRGFGRTKDSSVSNSSGNISENQNVLISTDSEIVISNFLEALKIGNRTEAEKYISKKVNQGTVNKLFDGRDRSLLDKNFSYEFINKYEEKTGTIIRVTARLNYNQVVSYYTFSLLKETVESSWLIADVEIIGSQRYSE